MTESERAAAHAYDDAAVGSFGEFAALNFLKKGNALVKPLAALREEILRCGYPARPVRRRSLTAPPVYTRPDELRRYLDENEPELAAAFGTDVDTFRNRLGGLADDVLGPRLLEELKRNGTEGREARAVDKAKAATAAADRLGASAEKLTALPFRDFAAGANAYRLDVDTLFECLTKPTDVLVLETPEFTSRIFMRGLKDVAALHRDDLAAYVTAECLTVYFGDHGRLRFRSHAEFELKEAKDRGARFVTAKVLPTAAAKEAA